MQFWVNKLKADLIPHFDFLALEVRKDIDRVLCVLCDNPTK